MQLGNEVLRHLPPTPQGYGDQFSSAQSTISATVPSYRPVFNLSRQPEMQMPRQYSQELYHLQPPLPAAPHGPRAPPAEIVMVDFPDGDRVGQVTLRVLMLIYTLNSLFLNFSVILFLIFLAFSMFSLISYI